MYRTPSLFFRLMCSAIAIISGVFFNACAIHDRPRAAVNENVPSEIGSLDLELARISREAPSFVGLVMDETGVYHARLANMQDSTALKVALERFFVRNRSPSGLAGETPRIVVEPANTGFTWLQLLAFKEALRDVFVVPSTAFLDADEACGCIAVGVTNEGAREEVLRFAERVQIPVGALQVVLTGPRLVHQSLTDQFRPMIGGIQIKNDSGPIFATGICTISAIGERVGATGFLTASHCTRILGGPEGTSFYQNGRALFWQDYVSHESVDPNWIAMPGCMPGMFCRRSDAAFTVIDIGNQNGALGMVARPTTICSGNVPCSLSMSSSAATITLTGLVGALVEGTPVAKIGRTSGGTIGAVSRTCVD